MFRKSLLFLSHYGPVFAAVGLATILRFALNPLFGQDVPFIIYFPAVAVSGWLAGFRGGILATTASTLCSWYFFIAPWSFSLPSGAFAQLLVFVLSGVLISLLSENLRVSRLLAEESKREEEAGREQLRVTLSSIGDAVIATDGKARISFINPVAQRLTGWSDEDARGKTLPEVFNIVNELTRKQVEDPVARVFREGTVVGLANHTVLVAKNGLERPIDDSAAPIRNDKGAVIGAVLVFRDVTEHRRGHEVLARLGAIVESSDDAIIGKDLNGVITSWNAGAEKIFGYSSDEVIGKHISLIIPQDHLHEETTILEKLRRGERINHYETLRRTKDGQILTISLTVSPIKDESGRIIGASKIARDITDKRQSEDTIRKLLSVSEKLNSTLDPDMLMDVLVYEVIRLLNAESGRSGLYSHDRMQSTKYFRQGDPLPMEHSWRADEGLPGWLIAHRSPYVTNDAAADPQIDSELPLSMAVRSALAVPVINSRGDLLGFFEIHNKRERLGFTEADVQRAIGVSHIAAMAIQNALAYQEALRAEEERRRLLQRERSARAKAEEASRVKDEFLATVSHELRTPLNAILGWAAMLRADKLDHSATQRAIEIIERNARSQTQIIEDILDVSRIIGGRLRLEMQQLDTASVIANAVESIRPNAAAKGIEIHAALDNVGSVFADPERIQQIVWNLMSNAIKFTGKGGRIYIRLERDGSHVNLIVSDNGQGIKRDFLPYVFDRFRQADSSSTRNHRGLGLGLAIVRHLVELHGGSVRAESPGEGMGSTFSVSLPSTAVRLADKVGQSGVYASASSTLGSPVSLIGIKVLIVDDEPDARFLLRAILEQMQAEVREADSVSTALSEIEVWKPDVLVSDVGMPGEDGYSLIRKVREWEMASGTAVAAVAVTAYAGAEDKIRALSAGYQMHVPKPVNPAELAIVVATVLESKRQSAGSLHHVAPAPELQIK